MAHTEYSIHEIAGITGGTLSANNPEHQNIAYLLTDSRKVVSPELSLFFAIKGDHRDGHEFIPELISQGVVNFVVSNPDAIPERVKVNYIVVPQPLVAMQLLASWHRSRFHMPVVGITGSNGKTIVKEWLFQLLRQEFRIVRSPKSYNSQIGVPLSVWLSGEEDSLGLFEAGISKPGEMEALEKIIRPTIGIFTNIGQAHDENFSNPEEKIREKLILFRRCSKIIYCKDYTAVHEIVKSGEGFSEATGRFTWSRKSKADLQIARVSPRDGGTEIQGIYENRFISIAVPFSDEASVENAIHCWALMLILGIQDETIAHNMEMLSPVAMRLEMKEGMNDCSIINDSYNSDIGSLTIALDFITQQKQHNRRTVILSDILQSGRDEKDLYNEVASLLARKNIHRLIGIGPAISRQHEQFFMEKKFFNTTEDFLHDFNYNWFQHETILIKGARTFGFERISKALQQKAHETVLEINLNAIIHNYNLFRSRIKPETRMMAMVKAFAYGSGSYEIASMLQFHRVDYLAVAYADEGVQLRNTGITLPIMVMNPEEQSFDQMITHKLEPEIYNFRLLSHFSEAVRRRIDTSQAAHIPVHIELDTGMKRLGFEEEDIHELILRLKKNKYLKIASLFSHLVASDEAQHDAFTQGQIRRFQEMSESIAAHFNYPILRHILNSGGIIRFPEAQFDMVRLGIGLHGVAPSPNEQRQMQTVATLKTTISQIKQVKAGESIGYSRRAIAEKDMTIATVGIGYADGYNRKFGNGAGKMHLLGQLVPTVGSICMDMCMIDITGLPAKEGTEVIVFGQEPDILALSKTLNTIPYEILTSVSERVKRVYYHE